MEACSAEACSLEPDLKPNTTSREGNPAGAQAADLLSRERTEDDAKIPPRFGSVLLVDVPSGRNGKHREIARQLLSDMEQLEPGSALKVPLADLPDTEENIRSALNRATRERGIPVSTSCNDHPPQYLEVLESTRKLGGGLPEHFPLGVELRFSLVGFRRMRDTDAQGPEPDSPDRRSFGRARYCDE